MSADLYVNNHTRLQRLRAALERCADSSAALQQKVLAACVLGADAQTVRELVGPALEVLGRRLSETEGE